jgi:hypothetical protein
MRKNTSSPSESASPQPSDAAPNAATPARQTARCPNRETSQPASGVATAVATMFAVTTQAIWSCVADSAPCICGSDTLAMVTVIA